MKLVELKLKNFRGYQEETTITFEDLTVLIGKNDSGKSSILDALNIFFNDAAIDKEDACVFSGSSDVYITCVFNDLPDVIIIDEQHPTSLANEYLVRDDGCLEICRVFACSAAKGKQSKIYARALHPSSTDYSDLLSLKITDLKARAKSINVDLSLVNQTISSAIRQAIWLHSNDLSLNLSNVDLASDSGKKIWEQIQFHLPVFALFKSDRTSTDQDDEAQDPMKAAIKETIKNHETELNNILNQVKSTLENVARRTVEKIQEMNPELASQLDPQVKNKNWDSLFSVSLTGDDGIPINKRGSGTRRLVLLNFFRAQAEDSAFNRSTGIIYAIEEPETSQHPNHQILLLDVLQDLTLQGKCQIIITTHTPTLARRVERNSLRLITSVRGTPEVHNGSLDSTLVSIKNTLGVLPDHDIKVFLGVEGKWDIHFLKSISKTLSISESDIPNLEEAETRGSLVFIPLGGSNMELWATRLAGLERPEFYITDRDNPPPAPPKYNSAVIGWNDRGCRAWITDKCELENYIHPDVIRTISPTFPATINDFDDVPYLLAELLHSSDPSANPWSSLDDKKQQGKASNAKRRLNTECVNFMTPQLLTLSDPNDEIRSWLREIGIALSSS